MNHSRRTVLDLRIGTEAELTTSQTLDSFLLYSLRIAEGFWFPIFSLLQTPFPHYTPTGCQLVDTDGVTGNHVQALVCHSTILSIMVSYTITLS